jgi:ribonucleoside-diphosphate reductase alpha chain
MGRRFMQEQNLQVATNLAPLMEASGEKTQLNKHEYIQHVLGETSPFLVKNILQRFDSLDHGLASKKEILDLLIQQCANLTFEEPAYSKIAVRFLLEKIDLELQEEGIQSFYDSFVSTCRNGITSAKVLEFVEANKTFLNDVVDHSRSLQFEYFGLRTVYDRYLIKHPKKRTVLESPQYFYMRVACGLAKTKDEVVECYHLLSSFDFMSSTPTLFNSGTRHPQLSSCFLLDSPQDDLKSIYQKYTDIAMLSKFSGGIGVAYHRVRSDGSLIQGTNGKSNGIIPWLKTLDSSVLAVNQGGKRKGACCVYLETWHADIEPFLEMRNNTGDEGRRAHNLNLANWIPDLFMKRVNEGGMWSLFDPKIMPTLTDLYGEEFEKVYTKAEEEKLYVRQVPARDLYAKMMKTLAETGNGWMTFKDATNLKCNQTGRKNRVVHLSNLCTEITEVTSNEETAVCNLGSINLGNYVIEGKFDFEKLELNAKKATVYLDRVIDINYYPTDQARHSNRRWRPIGLGVMGLQDAFFQLRLPFDSAEALELSNRIQETIYYAALCASNQLAKESGPHLTFFETRAASGKLQFDLWGIQPTMTKKWDALKKDIEQYGLRNSLLLAIAPTATIASIVGCFESIEPQISNLFKRETLSGEFIQVNKYLVNDLKKLGLWTQEIKEKIKTSNGSIQGIEEIPHEIRNLYRTVWEYSMKSLIDLAAGRGAYLDQSQSLNLFQESPNIGKLSSMYFYAWQKGLKTTYYLRSRPATEIKKTTATSSEKKSFTAEEAVVCSLENPESCEACT